MFVELAGTDHAFNATRVGGWLQWSGNYWRLLSDEQALVAGRCVYDHLLSLVRGEDLDRVERQAKRARTAGNTARIVAFMRQAAGLLTIEDERLNARPELLPCANGVIHLPTGRLLPGNRADWLIHASAVAYDKNAACPRWEQFIN